MKFDKTILINEKKIIKYDKFINNDKLYLKNDIINTICYYKNKYKKSNLKKKKKDELFIILNIIFNNYDLKKIIKLQSYIRKFLSLLYNDRGPGYYNKSKIKNEEDFYYMKNINEIDNIYFYSYKDNLNNIWGFDIRSIYNLLLNDNKNPWTREPIPQNIIYNVHYIINKLKKKKIDVNLEKYEIKDENKKTYQMIVDYVSEITRTGYNCEVNWVYNLTIFELKKLYKGLEDLWNYRLQIPINSKIEIIPPTGILFNIPITYINKIKNKNILINIILTELYKFNLTNSMPLGCMYFLICLSDINLQCRSSNILLQL
tara:strand:+ start:1646 stop:2593 length:948 start_codon:yes stop_codon:yes gene_type:complete